MRGIGVEADEDFVAEVVGGCIEGRDVDVLVLTGAGGAGWGRWVQRAVQEE